MSYSTRIQDIPASERPRERLMSVGAQYLSNSELIAILIGSGDRHRGLSAVGLVLEDSEYQLTTLFVRIFPNTL